MLYTDQFLINWRSNRTCGCHKRRSKNMLHKMYIKKKFSWKFTIRLF